MDSEFGSFKLLEEVRLKATYNMKIGNREFEEGETIALFDNIQISGLKEIKDYTAARGGVVVVRKGRGERAGRGGEDSAQINRRVGAEHDALSVDYPNVGVAIDDTVDERPEVAPIL